MGKKTFVLHDESVNTQGFRMLTSGANLEEFRKNPVMLENHNDWDMPIGRWENIRIEGGRILADAVFDKKDPRAQRIESKVESDFVRMASIGAWPPEEISDAYDLMLPGQTLPTVTKWTVREASIVPIGSNHNALTFYDRDTRQPMATNDREAIVRLMDYKPKNNIKMGKLTELLQLQDTANENQIVATVQGIIANRDVLKTENDALKAKVTGYETAQKEARKNEAIALVDEAVKDFRIHSKGREAFLKLFDDDFEQAKKLLESIPARPALKDILPKNSLGKTALSDLAKKDWDTLDKEGRLLELKDKAPELYKEKFKERFGVEPTL